ncbi:MAG: S41 family peptidase [Flaviramulus sp.]|nr:S41 family peptidase [Flaviramulus sp.]
MKNIFITVSLIFSLNLFGQDCDCLKNITFLQEKVEKNQASYQHQVIESNRKDVYDIYKNKMNTLSKEIDNKRDCIGLISIYLDFFRDEHSFIYYDEHFSAQDHFQKKIKSRKNSLNEFEGLWYFEDGSFSIKITPSVNGFSKWLAIIQKGYKPFWKKGQVKIEFFQDENQNLKCIYWRQNLIPKVYDVTVSDSVLSIGRYLNFYRNKTDNTENSSFQTNNLVFKELTVNTNYLKLPSFDLSQTHKIDSLITLNKHFINSKRNLIIDVINNGGGGFDAFKSILPYILDSEIVEQPYYGSVWVSKDNLEYYDRTKYEYAETEKDSIDELKYVQFLKEHKGIFTPIEMEKDTISLSSGFLEKIGVIFNRNTASSAEGFILTSSYSEKVKTFGENTMGAVSYGDWMPIEIPELNIWIVITTKKMIFQQNEDFESIGISPNVDLSSYKEEDWINIVLNNLEEK